MSDTASLPYAVIGATGQQGGAVVDALLDAGVPVRAVVRDAESERSRALADRGVELRVADQEDLDALTRALEGTAGVFAMTTFVGEDGTAGEVRRGGVIADAVEAAGVPRVVYSSVGGADRETGVPHFESKRRNEERLESHPEVRFVRPVFFMENLADQVAAIAADPEADAVLRLPMPGDLPVQMIAMHDIGRASAAVLLDPEAIDGSAIEIAGDQLTLDRAAELTGERLGRPVRYEALPIEVLGGNEDLTAMFLWFGAPKAYDADFAATERLIPGVLDLRGWLQTLPL